MAESIYDFPEGTTAECVQCGLTILLDQKEGGGPAKDWGSFIFSHTDWTPEQACGSEERGLDYGCGDSPLNDDEGTGGHSPQAGTICVPQTV